jgi:hypothetical protein
MLLLQTTALEQVSYRLFKQEIILDSSTSSENLSRYLSL